MAKRSLSSSKCLDGQVVACDRYPNAPAMQVADRSHSFSMQDGVELRRVIEAERPDYIVPEIEAIVTDTLVELEAEGFTVIPTARAARLTMNREGILRLVAEDLGIPTSSHRFADTYAEFDLAVAAIGLPCVVKSPSCPPPARARAWCARRPP